MQALAPASSECILLKNAQHQSKASQAEAKVLMPLSFAKPEASHTYSVSAIGNRTTWPDKEMGSAEIKVLDGTNGMVQTMNVSVLLRPYASCQNTLSRLSSTTLTNKDHITHIITPRDTDDLPISITPVEYRILLHHGHRLVLEQAHTADSRNGTNSVILEPLDREGRYSVTVELINGWNHRAWQHGRCELAPQHFEVSCSGPLQCSRNRRDRNKMGAGGFEPSADRKCARIDLNNKCAAANVRMNGLGQVASHDYLGPYLRRARAMQGLGRCVAWRGLQRSATLSTCL